jgi:RNA polymerase sigma-70 factor (ECF subfamily)
MSTKQELFDKLFKKHQRKLFSVAYTVVPNRDTAEDILQDAYLKAWAKFDDYDTNKKFENWMTTIVRNTGIDSLRSKRNKAKSYEISLQQNLNANGFESQQQCDIVDKNLDTFKLIEKQEFIEQLHSVIENLPDGHKQCMSLFAEGHSYEEIAERTQSPLSTVRMRIRQAKLKIRKFSQFEDYSQIF